MSIKEQMCAAALRNLVFCENLNKIPRKFSRKQNDFRENEIIFNNFAKFSIFVATQKDTPLHPRFVEKIYIDLETQL